MLMLPPIKVRHKRSVMPLLYRLLHSFHLLLWLLASPSTATTCDKTPLGQTAERSGTDGGFAIKINGSPRKYRPGQTYTISLEGDTPVLGSWDFSPRSSAVDDERDVPTKKFQEFMLVAEPQTSSALMPPSLGTFSLFPGGEFMTKFSHVCSNALEATSHLSKAQVQVYWQAPLRGSGCINFKAMAVERQDTWHMDNGKLTYTLCEDDSPVDRVPPVHRCCACNEAKYEVIFEGIWSRHTHPKDFPRDEWRTEFSTLIGASHAINYTMWEYGRNATRPLRILGEKGRTRMLEAEMKRHSGDIRSVIKAHGLHQRSNVVGRTFAVFRVSPRNHLLSLVSKMIPSPDWIVGLSKENLCTAECTWVEDRVIDLYPWDIGTQAGLRYESPLQPSQPREIIHRITSSNPANEASPFFDPTSAPIKPTARLHIIRQREYSKPCPGRPGQRGGAGAGGVGVGVYPPAAPQPPPSYGSGGGGGGYPPDVAYEGNGIGPQLATDYYQEPTYDDVRQPSHNYNYEECEVTSWTPWSTCTECKTGSTSRTRSFTSGGDRESCGLTLFEKELCSNTNECLFNPFPHPSDSADWNDRGLESDARLNGDNGGGGGGDWPIRPQPPHGPPAPPQLSYPYDGYYPYDGSYDDDYAYDTASSPHGGYASGGGRAGGGYGGSSGYGGGYGGSSGYGGGGGYGSSGYGSSSGFEDTGQQQQRPQQPSRYGNSYTYGGPRYTTPQVARQISLPQGDSAQNCQLSAWGDWSDCSRRCGVGTRTRTRRYVDQEHSLTCTEELDGMEGCDESGVPGCYSQRPPARPIGQQQQRQDAYQRRMSLPSTHAACQTSSWSQWSPCSSRCSEGTMVRTRLFIIPFFEGRSCDNVRLLDRDKCQGTHFDCHGGDEYMAEYNVLGDESPDADHLGAAGRDDEDEQAPEPDAERAREDDEDDRCYLERDSGPCRGHYARWYFDPPSGKCKAFIFYGCNGNRNNFATKEICELACAHGIVEEDELNHPFRQLQSLSLLFEPEPSASSPVVPPARRPPPPQPPQQQGPLDWPPPPPQKERPPDCTLSDWTDWSPCSASCGGEAWQTKTRTVLTVGARGGSACPRKRLRRRKCRRLPTCQLQQVDTRFWYQGNWRHMED